MKKAITPLTALAPTGMGAVDKAWDAVSISFDRFCLTAWIEALGTMMEQDAEQACGARHARGDGRRGHRWGRTQGKIGFHAGKVAVERPRVRDLAGRELALPSWERAVAEDWLGKWAMSLMLINVSTREIPPSGAAMVELSQAERNELKTLLSGGKHSARGRRFYWPLTPRRATRRSRPASAWVGPPSTGPSAASCSAIWRPGSAKSRAPEQAASSLAKRKRCWSRRPVRTHPQDVPVGPWSCWRAPSGRE